MWKASCRPAPLGSSNNDTSYINLVTTDTPIQLKYHDDEGPVKYQNNNSRLIFVLTFRHKSDNLTFDIVQNICDLEKRKYSTFMREKEKSTHFP